MATVFVRASRRARAYTRISRLMLVNRKINARLARSTKGKPLGAKRETQLYKLQKNVKSAYASEVNKKHHIKKF